jgi:hypothetical protein
LRGAPQKHDPGSFHSRDAREAFWPHHTRRWKESPILRADRTAAWAGGDARSEWWGAGSQQLFRARYGEKTRIPSETLFQLPDLRLLWLDCQGGKPGAFTIV